MSCCFYTIRIIMPNSKWSKYSAKFKLQVVKFAKNTNNSAAGQEFDVNEKLVRDWRRHIEKIRAMPKNKCTDWGKKYQWPELEKELQQWVEDQRKSGYIITRNLKTWHKILYFCIIKHGVDLLYTQAFKNCVIFWLKNWGSTCTRIDLYLRKYSKLDPTWW